MTSCKAGQGLCSIFLFGFFGGGGEGGWWVFFFVQTSYDDSTIMCLFMIEEAVALKSDLIQLRIFVSLQGSLLFA